MSFNNVLLVTSDYDENLNLSSRNLINVEYTDSNHLNPVSLIAHEKVVMTADAIKKFEEGFSNE